MPVCLIPIQELKPIKRISPSRYTALRKCALKEIWSANRILPLLPTSPVARLGAVCHKLLELAGQGKLGSDESMIEAWDKIINEAESEMRTIALEKHLVPLSKHASNYSVKMHMTFSLASELSKRARKTSGVPSETKSETETWLESSDGKIGGKVDLIRHSGDGAEISDYKSGAVLDEKKNDGLPKEEYQMQLRLYAGLYHFVKGAWPQRLNVISLDQQVYDVPFEKDDCLRLMEEAKIELDALNDRIAQGENIRSFANPSPEACFFCAYRPACEKYWETRQDNGDWPLDIAGTIVQKKVLGNGTVRVVIQKEEKRLAIRGLSPARHSFLNEDTGNVVFCNLGHDTARDCFMQTSLTAGYRIQ